MIRAYFCIRGRFKPDLRQQLESNVAGPLLLVPLNCFDLMCFRSFGIQFPIERVHRYRDQWLSFQGGTGRR